MHIEWGPFLLALVVIILVPGPDFVLVTSSAAANRRTGWFAAAGVTCGQLVHATAATLGLSALLVAVPGALFVVKTIGAVYLVYLGLQILRRAGSGQLTPDGMEVAPSGRSVFFRGLFIDVLNPKVMLMFLTLLPQAMDPAGEPVRQAAVLSAVAVASFGIYWMIIVPSVRWLTAFLSQPRRKRVFERCCGGVLLAMATSIVFA